MNEDLHIGFTGTRWGMTPPQLAAFKELLVDVIALQEGNSYFLHHGDCVGADAQAHQTVRELGGSVWLHPPTNSSHRAYCDWDEREHPKDYMVRNEDIVARSDMLIGTPWGTAGSLRGSGTWATIRRGRARGIPVWVVWPNGEVETP